MTRWQRLTNWVGVGAVVAVGAVVGVAAHKLSGPERPRFDYAFSPFEIGAPAEDVTFTAADGVTVAGWWFEQPDSSTVVICCHGHHGCKSDMLGIGPGLFRAGFSVLVFDFRGNGDSDDGRQSLAHYERADLRAAVDWVSERRPDDSIAVMGFSMGAAVAVLEAAEDPRISTVVADSPFATMREVVASNLRRRHLPAMLTPLVNLWTRLRYGYWFDQVRPIDAISRIAPRPLLLMHGENDGSVPHEHSRQLATAAGVPLLTFAGAGHCGGYFQDRPGYLRMVIAFLRNPTAAPSFPPTMSAQSNTEARPSNSQMVTE